MFLGRRNICFNSSKIFFGYSSNGRFEKKLFDSRSGGRGLPGFDANAFHACPRR